MHRRFSAFGKSSAASSSSFFSSTHDIDEKSEASTIFQEVDAPPPKLKVKRVDHYYSRWAREWKYRNMSSKVTVETRPVMKLVDSDPWKDFAFVVVRTLPKTKDEWDQEPTFKIVIKSEYVLKACKDVIQTWPGVSWNAEPLSLDPEMFLTFIPAFITYKDELLAKKNPTDEEKHVVSSVNVLLECLHSDFRDTINNINRLTSHGEITFDFLYAIFVPRSIIVAECRVTGEPRAFFLKSWARNTLGGKGVFQLVCESIDLVDKMTNASTEVGRVQTVISIPYFKGTVPIDSLDAFPLNYHPLEKELRKSLAERGKRWLSLTGIHHMQYNGIAAYKAGSGLVRHNISSRIMIDRKTFQRLNPNYIFPTSAASSSAWGEVNGWDTNADMQQPMYDSEGMMVSAPPAPVAGPGDADAIKMRIPEDPIELSDEDILLTSPIVYGFSLSDKIWMEFNINKVKEVEWNEDAFENLVLPKERKVLLQSLVESHHRELGFDDFIKGKGHGLVINLFGPPGVGKTFSAEATSEHVKRPLYVIGAGDLGTFSSDLDENLEKIFDVATAWKAIVLIDEADVFLEQRSLHDLHRNAAVAVFLRHVEYYRGILFLTTNRVKAFDEAFLSRIHVALHFHELDQSSRLQVWTAFLNKIKALNNITSGEMQVLASRNINGRQIKNAARTAHSLAVGRGEKLTLEHLLQTLDAMEEFTKEFDTIVKKE